VPWPPKTVIFFCPTICHFFPHQADLFFSPITTQIDVHFSDLGAGLPDFSGYKIPKQGKYTK
jgi:hypothetical protein